MNFTAWLGLCLPNDCTKQDAATSVNMTMISYTCLTFNLSDAHAEPVFVPVRDNVNALTYACKGKH